MFLFHANPVNQESAVPRSRPARTTLEPAECDEALSTECSCQALRKLTWRWIAAYTLIQQGMGADVLVAAENLPRPGKSDISGVVDRLFEMLAKQTDSQEALDCVRVCKNPVHPVILSTPISASVDPA